MNDGLVTIDSTKLPASALPVLNGKRQPLQTDDGNGSVLARSGG